MAPRKVTTENTAEPRRSSRIADKPKSPIEEKPPPKPRAKKGSISKKRGAEADDAAEDKEKRQAKKAKGSGDENGEEQDELADDDDEVAEEVVKVLEVGDILPAVTLKNEKDEDVNVAELAAEKGLVLFLVPKADTSGCTKHACGYRDSYPDFTKYNFNVFGVSADTATAQAKWQAKYELPYSLLSDRQRVLIKVLGAADGNKTKRSHFIFEKGGKLVDIKNPAKPVESSQEALQFIQSLQV